MLSKKIAIVDDEAEIANAIAHLLATTGLTVEVFNSAAAILERLKTTTFSLVICDWTMPEMDGIHLIGRLRRNSDVKFPILMLTSRSGEADIVAGLNAGADDYIAKPVSKDMLCARVTALLRRDEWRLREHVVGDVMHFGEYALDPVSNTIAFSGESVEMSIKEFKLAQLLFANPEKVYSRQMIADTVWGAGACAIVADTKTINTHMYMLRKKLKLNASGLSGLQLRQVYGIGYVLTSGRGRTEEMAAA
jgi:two-component system, OmpR family, phosphate regulon response regulator PhoB